MVASIDEQEFICIQKSPAGFGKAMFPCDCLPGGLFIALRSSAKQALECQVNLGLKVGAGGLQIVGHAKAEMLDERVMQHDQGLQRRDRFSPGFCELRAIGGIKHFHEWIGQGSEEKAIHGSASTARVGPVIGGVIDNGGHMNAGTQLEVLNRWAAHALV